LLIAFVCSAFAAKLVVPETEHLVKDSYIVIFKNSTLSSSFRDRHISYLAENKIQPSFVYDIDDFVGYAVKVSNKSILQFILDDPNVKLVEQDQMMFAVQNIIQDNAPWHLDRVSKHDINDMNGEYEYRVGAGSGVIVYVIDTGVRCTHNDFKTNRCTFPYDATGEGLFDGNGHGTHVASLAGGNTYGVAKKVTIVAVKVLTSGGSGTTAGVIAGVNYVSAQFKANRTPSVSNMSLGGGASQALDDSVTASIASGVSYAIAAGNDNRDACLYSPARVASAMTVGATELDDLGSVQSDSRSDFSNWGTCVDILAPGTALTAAWIGTDTATRTISGTSMASPVTCGVMALVLSSNPGLTPSQLGSIVVAQSTQGVINMQCTTTACQKTPNRLVYSLTE